MHIGGATVMVFAFTNILMFLFDIFFTFRINHEYFPNTVKPLSALTLPQGHQFSLAIGCLLYFSGIFLCVALRDNYTEFSLFVFKRWLWGIHPEATSISGECRAPSLPPAYVFHGAGLHLKLTTPIIIVCEGRGLKTNKIKSTHIQTDFLLLFLSWYKMEFRDLIGYAQHIHFFYCLLFRGNLCWHGDSCWQNFTKIECLWSPIFLSTVGH